MIMTLEGSLRLGFTYNATLFHEYTWMGSRKPIHVPKYKDHEILPRMRNAGALCRPQCGPHTQRLVSLRYNERSEPTAESSTRGLPMTFTRISRHFKHSYHRSEPTAIPCASHTKLLVSGVRQFWLRLWLQHLHIFISLSSYRISNQHLSSSSSNSECEVGFPLHFRCNALTSGGIQL